MKISLVVEVSGEIKNALSVTKEIEDYITTQLKYKVIGIHIKNEDKPYIKPNKY